MLASTTGAADPEPTAKEPSTVATAESPETSTTAVVPPPVTSTTASTEPEPATARYPRSAIARPLTLPEGLVAIGADATSNRDFSSATGAPIAGYGITDKAEIQVGYAFATRELEPRGTVAVDFGYAVIRGALDGKLEAVARARAGYDVLGTVVPPLMFGLHVQYSLTPWLALISGTAGSQQLAISVADSADDTRPSYVQLPLGMGVQATDELYLQLDTKLGRIGMNDSEHALIGRDETPLAVTVVYNIMNALDVQASVGADVSSDVGDTLSLLVGARYYAGDL